MTDCGSKINDSCTTELIWTQYNADNNSSVTWANASDGQIYWAFKTMASEVVSIGTFLITTTLATSSSSMSMNMVKGLNALRCAFSSGFINVWMLMGALYFAARQFGQEAQMTDKIDEYYPYLCTCKDDVQTIQEALAVSGQQAKVFASCTEN